jgi:hypothetical protein
MRARTLPSIALTLCLCVVASCSSTRRAPQKAVGEGDSSFGAAEWKRSAVPLRPGEPGKSPFWNAYAKRFIFAPAFDFKRIDNAVKYRYEIFSLSDSRTRHFESESPHAPLSPVWTSVPVGNFDLKVTGVSAQGEDLGIAGEGRYFRAAPFNGPYHEPVMPYGESGRIALNKIMHPTDTDPSSRAWRASALEHWLTHKAPDPTYFYNRYPAKIFGSLVVGAVTHAKMNAANEDGKRSTELARIVADYLISISFPKGAHLEYFPPAYYGETVGNNPQSHMQLSNYMIIAAAESGHAYLDLYDHTGDENYLEAAKRIARTYLKTQLENGTWILYVNHETGKPTAGKMAIPTSTIIYLERLKDSYGMEGLEDSIQRAFDWIMQNPVKTFEWLAQYEDINLENTRPYQRMSREQPCDFAIYLFKKYPGDPKYMELAEDLIRFAEDQFITWERMEEVVVAAGTFRPPYPPRVAKRSPGWFSKNWMMPVVHEQYGFWMPSARNTGLMIETYWHAYGATKKDVYLAKAISIANNFTRVQQKHDGDYPTMFTPYKMNFWINNSIYPARVMMTLQNNLDKNRIAIEPVATDAN